MTFCIIFHIILDGLSFSVMVDCDNKILRSHCFWPFASDLTNVLSHQSVAKLFLESDDILCKWIHVVKLLTGILFFVFVILKNFFFASSATMK